MIIAISTVVGVTAIAIATVPGVIGMHLHKKDEPWTSAPIDNVDIVDQSGRCERSSVLSG
jgi:hypothetical protein